MILLLSVKLNGIYLKKFLQKLILDVKCIRIGERFPQDIKGHIEVVMTGFFFNVMKNIFCQ